jgi:predicted Zn-dependent protease
LSDTDYGYGRGSRIPPRLILAVVIAGIAIISYYSQTQRNPVTGKMQRVALSVDQERALGLEAAPKMAREMGGAIPGTDPRARLVSDVGRRLVRDSEAGRSPYADNFHFVLLDDPKTVNAFALPGGQIFITRGLFSKLRDEAEVAGVLGHEIGHVINRHTAQQMAKGRLGGMLATAVGVGASDDRGSGRNAEMAAAMVNQMMQLKYGRNDESEADHVGLKYMAQSGYDPRGMLDVMKVLSDVSKGQRQPEFLASHPLPETRLIAIRDELKHAYPEGIPAELSRGRSLERLNEAFEDGDSDER